MRAFSPVLRFRNVWRSVRDEHASNVAQAGAVAILAAALIGAMVLAMPSLSSTVDRSFSCLVSVLGGSGAGCSSGAGAQQATAQQARAHNRAQDDGGWSWGGILDGVQIGLDVLGLVPGFGEIADGVNGVISLARGDYVGAALSFGAMIPFAGWASTGAKWVRTGVKYSDEAAGIARYGDEVADAAKYGDEAASAGRQGDNVPIVCPVGAAPGNKVPGLARPALKPCKVSYQPKAGFTGDVLTKGYHLNSEIGELSLLPRRLDDVVAVYGFASVSAFVS